MNSRRLVAALAVVVALAATTPVRADWTEPDPGPGEVSPNSLILAAQIGLQIAQVAL